MNDHDALLRAICENPREDTSRLAFADWLDENGQPERAAFIRSDIAMSLRDEWDAERIRWEALLTPDVLRKQPWFANTYSGPYPLAGYSWGGTMSLRRGFPWSASVYHSNRQALSVKAPTLFAQHPIECLQFIGLHPDFAKLITEPWFPRLTGIGWTAGRCGPLTLRPLLNLPPAGLARLDLNSNGVNPDGMRAIGAKLFPTLTHLSVSKVNPQVISAMLESLEADLKSCRMRSLHIDVPHLQGYARGLAACLPPSVRALDISVGRIYSTEMLALLGALATSELKLLRLSQNGIGNEGATAVFTSPQLAGLKVLDLSYCMVGDEALRALLENSPLADGLNLLNLTGSPASADMKQAVKERMGDRVRL